MNYIDFVGSRISEPSANLNVFGERLQDLSDDGAYVTMLLTAGMGLPAEAGEFAEIVKKVFFQGKPYDEQTMIHLKKELGDLLFYAAVACIALGTDLDEIIEINRAKLEARYPNGFSVERSENRDAGDI